jgi:hypothetical protein
MSIPPCGTFFNGQRQAGRRADAEKIVEMARGRGRGHLGSRQMLGGQVYASKFMRQSLCVRRDWHFENSKRPDWASPA